MITEKHTKNQQLEFYEEKIDVSIFKKKTNSKTYAGWLIGKIKQAKNDNNFELVYLLSEMYQKYKEFESEQFNPKQWRGKSGVKFIEKPDLVISIRFRKSEPDSIPKEITMELLRTDINRVIWAISRLNKDISEKGWIGTKDIAELVYNKNWKLVFSNRHQHTHLVEILNYLEYKNKIIYSRSGKIKVIPSTNN